MLLSDFNALCTISMPIPPTVALIEFFHADIVASVHPGGNTPQSTNYTDIYNPSRKLSKLDEQGMQDSAGEAGTMS